MSEQYIEELEGQRVEAGETAEVEEINEANAKAAPKEKKQAPCECANWEITVDGGEPEGTGCDGGLTTRDFIRGHDSKLKALFIKAGEQSWFTNVEVSANDGGVLVTMDWTTAANRFGFASQVHDAVERRQAKLAAKAERKAAREEAKAEKAASAPAAVVEPETEDEDWDTGPEWGDQDTNEPEQTLDDLRDDNETTFADERE